MAAAAEAAAAVQRDGFVVLRDVLSAEELSLLQEESMAQIEAGPDREPAGHFRSAPDLDGNPTFFRIEAPLGKRIANDSILAAMANPTILRILDEVFPDVYVGWGDALLWKGATGGPAVAMHSGHTIGATVGFENLVVDIYLDEATPDTGCLKVVPGSNHLSPEDNKALVAQGFDAPGIIDVVMSPGDVLIHSEWIVHGSLGTPPLGRPTRRILYFAFQDGRAFTSGDEPRTDRYGIATYLKRLQLAAERRAATVYGAGETRFDAIVPAGWEDEVASVTDEEVAALTDDPSAIGIG